MMDNKGYIYTLITITLALMLLSLALFYFESTGTKVEDISTKLRTDELYYFVESMGYDLDRSVHITAQRAATYAIDEVIETGRGLGDYDMEGRNCTAFVYGLNGSQAAIAELMLCGTLYGVGTDSAEYMQNHTLLDWIGKMEKAGDELNFDVDIEVKGINLYAYDIGNFAVLTMLDVGVKDRLGISGYEQRNMPVLSLIPTRGMEDPLYLLKTREPALIPRFVPCNESAVVDARVVDSWIDTQCYRAVDSAYNAPSFFDRIDGNLYLSEKYLEQSLWLKGSLGSGGKLIGIENFLNPERMSRYGIPVNVNNTWVDYLYWQNVSGECTVNGTAHAYFRIDQGHGLLYNITNLSCSI